MTIKLPLSGAPDQDWRPIFQGLAARILRARGLPTPQLEGAEIVWVGPEGQVLSALESLKVAIDQTNRDYPAAAVKRHAEQAKFEQQQAEAAKRHSAAQQVVDDFTF
jgi:hypothetical protein